MLRQLLIVATVFLLAWLGLPRLGLSLAGPVAVALVAVAAVVCVRRGGEGWAALGLAAPARPLRLLWVGPAYAVIGYLAAIAATLLATQLLGWAPMQSGKVGAVQGNLPALLGMLAIAWTTAALGEELLFRGFLQGRLQALLAGRRGAGLLAALAQGLVFGLLYLRSKSLWPLVIAHGLIDTLSLVALYAGKLPAQ